MTRLISARTSLAWQAIPRDQKDRLVHLADAVFEAKDLPPDPSPFTVGNKSVVPVNDDPQLMRSVISSLHNGKLARTIHSHSDLYSAIYEILGYTPRPFPIALPNRRHRPGFSLPHLDYDMAEMESAAPTSEDGIKLARIRAVAAAAFEEVEQRRCGGRTPS